MVLKSPGIKALSSVLYMCVYAVLYNYIFVVATHCLNEHSVAGRQDCYIF